MPVRILVAEEQGVFQGSLRTLLENVPGFEVVGEAENALDALRIVEERKVDILLLDENMQGPFGLRAAEEATRKRPELAVVLLATCEDEACVRKLMAPDIQGYVLKRSPGAELVKAIWTASRGGVHVDAALGGSQAHPIPAQGAAGDPHRNFACLTNREEEVCRLLALGHTNAEVGERLAISNRTVETHRMRIMSKLHLKNRAELVQFALDTGLLLSHAER